MIINIHNYHTFAREERSRSLPIINKSRKRINVSSDKFSTSGMPSPVSHFDQSGGVSHSRNTVTRYVYQFVRSLLPLFLPLPLRIDIIATIVTDTGTAGSAEWTYPSAAPSYPAPPVSSGGSFSPIPGGAFSYPGEALSHHPTTEPVPLPTGKRREKKKNFVRRKSTSSRKPYSRFLFRSSDEITHK